MISGGMGEGMKENLENKVVDHRAGLEAALKQAELIGCPNGLEIARLNLEIYDHSHDNTGALKWNKFPEVVDQFFENNGLFFNNEGKLEISESQKDHRFLAIGSTGALSILNKEGGGHKDGDEYLSWLGGMVNRNMSKYEGERFRLSGGDFLVDISDISKDETVLISGILEKDYKDCEDRPSLKGIKDIPELVVTQLVLKDVVDIYNEARSKIDNDLDKEDAIKEASADILKILKLTSNYDLDIHTFISKFNSVIQKLDKDKDTAEIFFNTYMEETFKGVCTFDEVKKINGLENDEKKKKTINSMALKFATKEFDIDIKNKEVKDLIIDKFLKERIGRYSDGFSEENSEKDIANIPKTTKGGEIVEGLKKKFEEIKSRDPTKQSTEYKIAERRLSLEELRRDRNTGLLDRQSYYEDLDSVLENKEKEDIQVVFVDMGFLKYFDHKGGSDVGDSALRLAAKLMEDSLDGLNGTVYRYGGDEFTIILDGKGDVREKYLNKLEELRKGSGKIPSGFKGEQDGYQPTELNFNYGFASKIEAVEIAGEISESNKSEAVEIAGGISKSNYKLSKIVTELADRCLMGAKAIARIKFLLDRLRDEECEKYDPCREQTEVLTGYSQKAMLGGKNFLNDLKVGNNTYDDIEGWVLERLGVMFEEEGVFLTSLGQIIHQRAMKKLGVENQD